MCPSSSLISHLSGRFVFFLLLADSCTCVLQPFFSWCSCLISISFYSFCTCSDQLSYKNETFSSIQLFLQSVGFSITAFAMPDCLKEKSIPSIHTSLNTHFSFSGGNKTLVLISLLKITNDMKSWIRPQYSSSLASLTLLGHQTLRKRSQVSTKCTYHFQSRDLFLGKSLLGLAFTFACGWYLPIRCKQKEISHFQMKGFSKFHSQSITARSYALRCLVMEGTFPHYHSATMITHLGLLGEQEINICYIKPSKDLSVFVTMQSPS